MAKIEAYGGKYQYKPGKGWEVNPQFKMKQAEQAKKVELQKAGLLPGDIVGVKGIAVGNAPQKIAFDPWDQAGIMKKYQDLQNWAVPFGNGLVMAGPKPAPAPVQVDFLQPVIDPPFIEEVDHIDHPIPIKKITVASLLERLNLMRDEAIDQGMENPPELIVDIINFLHDNEFDGAYNRGFDDGWKEGFHDGKKDDDPDL